MKEVLALIEKEEKEFSQLPFFAFLKDRTIDPRQRLSWTPYAAPLIMGFADMNKYIFRKETSEDKIQKLINKHTYEDDYHWEWFLKDIDKLGFDKSQKFSDSLRFIWGEETVKTRLLWQEIALLIYQADPIIVLSAIKAEEATWNVVLPVTCAVTNEIQKLTKQRFDYFGKSHLDAENNHGIDTDEIQDFLLTIELTEEQKNKSFDVVHRIFKLFTEIVNDFMVYARNYPTDNYLKLHSIVKLKNESQESFSSNNKV
ncbi:MAG: hypothetical protein QNJ51_11985 [Calothrix sp. MO_167.B12]|nr:hypothetical protein [Calothrix sp. MO_167.B12]